MYTCEELGQRQEFFLLIIGKSPQIYAEGKNGSSIPQESWNRYLVAKNSEDEVPFTFLVSLTTTYLLSVSCKVAVSQGTKAPNVQREPEGTIRGDLILTKTDKNYITNVFENSVNLMSKLLLSLSD